MSLYKFAEALIGEKPTKILKDKHGRIIVFTENDMLTLNEKASKVMLEWAMKKHLKI